MTSYTSEDWAAIKKQVDDLRKSGRSQRQVAEALNMPLDEIVKFY